MRRIETGQGLPRLRVVVLLRQMDAEGKTTGSRSATLAPNGNGVPSLDEALEAATSAIMKLDSGREEEE